MSFLKPRRPFQTFKIVPLSINIAHSTNGTNLSNASSSTNATCINANGNHNFEYAIQYKKQTTPFDKTFHVDNNELFQLTIKTRKSSIRLFVLEKRIAFKLQKELPQKETITKKFKLRMKVQELKQNDPDCNEWKIFSVTLKDGSKLELKSMLVGTGSNSGSGNVLTQGLNDYSESQSCMTQDDLSTVIMGDNSKETVDELLLNIEEQELEIKSLELKIKEMEKEFIQSLQIKEEEIRKLREERNSLLNQNEVYQENEIEIRKHMNQYQDEIITLKEEKNRLISEIEADLTKTNKEVMQNCSIELSQESPNSFNSSLLNSHPHYSQTFSYPQNESNPFWVQKSLDFYNHITFIEQEVSTLKKMMDFEKLKREDKQHELVQKLRYYQMREEKIQQDKKQLLEFVSEGNKIKSHSSKDLKVNNSFDSLKNLLSNEKKSLVKLEIMVKFLSDYLRDWIEVEPHDKLLSDVSNPMMDKYIAHLATVFIEILSSGLTGPWRLTRKNTIWDCLIQCQTNLFSKRSQQNIALSEEELNLFYAIRRARRNEGKQLSHQWEHQFRIWMSIALNKQKLHIWIYILLKEEDLIKSYYDQKNSLLFNEEERTKLDAYLKILGGLPFSLNEN